MRTTPLAPARPMPDEPVGIGLARFVYGLAYQDIPPDVVALAKRSMLDALGIALQAHATPQARLLLAQAQAWGGAPEATVLGTTVRLPKPLAGLVGGLLCHSFDFDDTHLPSITHPSACVVPAALAAAEAAGGSGREAIVLAVIGYELMARIGRAASGQFQIRGLHATSVCGTPAVAALAARAQGADERGIANAIGCAASMASGILEPARDGTWTKLLQAGWAVHSGMSAAPLGAAGFLAPSRALEGEFGLYRAFVDNDFDAGLAVAGLGTDWETRAISIKLFPTCHHLHAFLESCLALVDEEGVKPEDIVAIELVVGEPQARVVCEPWAEKRAPTSDYAARFSLPHAVAAAFADGRVSLDQYSERGVKDPRIRELIERVTYRTEPNPDFPMLLGGDVTVVTGDGRRLQRRRPNCRGTPEGGPVTDADVRSKFIANAEPILGVRRAGEVIAAVAGIESVGVAALLRALQLPGAA